MGTRAPFGRNSNPDQLVDKSIGTAYPIVRYVAENIEYIKHVSYHLKNIYEVWEIRDDVTLVAADIESVVAVAGILDEVIALHGSLAEILAVYTNLAEINLVAGRLDELNTTLAAALAWSDQWDSAIAAAIAMESRLNTAENTLNVFTAFVTTLRNRLFTVEDAVAILKNHDRTVLASVITGASQPVPAGGQNFVVSGPGAVNFAPLVGKTITRTYLDTNATASYTFTLDVDQRNEMLAALSASTPFAVGYYAGGVQFQASSGRNFRISYSNPSMASFFGQPDGVATTNGRKVGDPVSIEARTLHQRLIEIEAAIDDLEENGVGGGSGDNGWTPNLALVADGIRVVQQVIDWFGGEGVKPEIGLYVGPLGLTGNIAEATNTKGIDGSDGDDGTDGTDGLNGLSAYQIAVNNGFVGNQASWLASLHGTDGTDGTDGVDGTDGEDGATIIGTEVLLLAWAGYAITGVTYVAHAQILDAVVLNANTRVAGHAFNLTANRTINLSFLNPTTGVSTALGNLTLTAGPAPVPVFVTVAPFGTVIPANSIIKLDTTVAGLPADAWGCTLEFEVQ